MLTFVMEENMEENVIVPEPGTTSTEQEDITADTIMEKILERDEDGFSPSVISVTLERFNNFTGDMNVPDEDREYIDAVNVERAAIDVSTFDGELFNLFFDFESPKSVILRELNELLVRYRTMTEEFATNGITDKLAVITVMIAPRELNGMGMLKLTMPTLYTRVLSDSGENAAFLMQFRKEFIEFMQLDISEEEKLQMQAEAMRVLEAGTGGNLFEE